VRTRIRGKKASAQQRDHGPKKYGHGHSTKARAGRVPDHSPFLDPRQNTIAGRLSLGVERQHPVPHRLQADAADLGGLAASSAVIDRRQRQQAPGLTGIVRSLCQRAQLRGLVIPPNTNRGRHGKPPLVCHGESYLRQSGLLLRGQV